MEEMYTGQGGREGRKCIGPPASHPLFNLVFADLEGLPLRGFGGSYKHDQVTSSLCLAQSLVPQWGWGENTTHVLRLVLLLTLEYPGGTSH